MEIQFFMPMNPPTVTQQQHRVGKGKNGKPVFYDSPELSEAKAKLTAYLAKHIPEQPFTGAVQLIVKWCFPVSAAHSQMVLSGQWKTFRRRIQDHQAGHGQFAEGAQRHHDKAPLLER